jgi:large subunit ribosomal protein L24
MSIKIRKGDNVKVLYGKDSGKTGKVIRVLRDESKVLVEGLNMYKKNMKGDGKTRQSEIVDVLKPMDVAKVMVVCNSCGKASRIAIKEVDGKRVRICKNCGKDIDAVVESKPVEKKTKKLIKDKK